MKSDPTYLLNALSNNDVTFFIPPYQRNYEWAVENCRVFLTDVERVAKSNNDSGVKTEHFFGSIVYVVEEGGFGVPSRYVLTDGQQRITTTMLFLMALRDTITDDTYKRQIQRSYLENDRADDTVEYKIKLKQVETDWDAYKALALQQEILPAMRASAVWQNYSFFKKQLDAMGNDQRKTLLEHGLARFSVIAIQLEPDRNPWENPQEIFESMNSLGRPLSLADLVRNYLLMGKESREQSSLYTQFWLPLEQRLPGRLSEFIRDWMQSDQHRSYKVARESNYKELYSAFKDIATGRSVEELFGSFVEYAPAYAMAAGLESTSLEQLDRVVEDLNLVGVGPAYSYLTEVILAWRSGRLTACETTEVFSGIRTYLLRRRLLGLTQAENKFYPVLGKRLPELETSCEKTVRIFEQLSSQEYALRLPNDDEMSTRLTELNFYNLGRSNNYPRLILSMVEEYLTKSRPGWQDSKLQLEHIMPQKLNASWKEELGVGFEEEHRELVNNVGNITIIRHNQELGNKSFYEKKRVYADSSGLQVARNWILDQDVWNAAAIRRRQQHLISIIVSEILAVPLQFQSASNWSQLVGGESSFNSREIMNRLIGEKIEMISDPSLVAEVVSDSKVIFEGEKWSLGPLTKVLKERSGSKISKGSNFHGASNWSWSGTRLVDLDF